MTVAEPARAVSISQLESIGAVLPQEWDSLCDSPYPFARHDFLQALETHGCVGGDTGWQPFHFAMRDRAGTLVAAAPCYLKSHSYGEFVFDFAWARASAQLRRPYYPKLLCAIPFVPSTGPRLLAPLQQHREMLASALGRSASDNRLSSAHALFVDAVDAAVLRHEQWLSRTDVQFQWVNRGYGSFPDFLATLTSDKRKKLLRERRRVAEAGIGFEWCRGDELDEAQWARVYALYSNTYEERGQQPYLSLEFFLDYGRRPGTPMRLVLACRNGEIVATALTLLGGDTLYGRHWGAAEHYHSLHFECCYHQGIEYCIDNGLQRFDAGTQGAHKLSRGFEPVLTRSLHHLTHPQLREAVENYLREERDWTAQRRDEYQRHVPFRVDRDRVD